MPDKRSPQPTLASAIPPAPPPNKRSPQSHAAPHPSAIPPIPDLQRVRTEVDTSVEVDAEAKARADAKATAAKQRSVSEMRTGPRELAVSEPTEIGVEIPLPPDAPTEETAEPGVTDQMAAQAGASTEQMASQGVITEQIAVQSETTDQTRAEAAEDANDERPSPLSTAPSSLPPPRITESVPSGPTPACPQCESPMVWVEEHLRFYCKECRMYF